MASEKPGKTLQATSLVHEAWLRLVSADDGDKWNGRGHFFAAAAEAMRRILVEDARRRNRQKRGGDRQRVELADSQIAAPQASCDLLDLDAALQRLAEQDPQSA